MPSPRSLEKKQLLHELRKATLQALTGSETYLFADPSSRKAAESRLGVLEKEVLRRMEDGDADS